MAAPGKKRKQANELIDQQPAQSHYMGLGRFVYQTTTPWLRR